MHILWLALQLGQFSIGRGLPVCLFGGPALYEVLPCGVSVLSGTQARYAGGLASLYYRAVTEPHLAACDKNIARFHHHLNPVGIGRVVLSLRLCLGIPV